MSMQAYRNAVGPCPTCGKTDLWFNDVPLRAFCWGPEDNPHPEMSRIVPAPAQPYGRQRIKTTWLCTETCRANDQK